MVEAVLFASRRAAEPARDRRAAAAGLRRGRGDRRAAAALRGARACSWCRSASAWAFRTAADLGFLMSREVVETRKLSRAAIETLAIVAYHQPVTRAEIEEIRGVSVSGGTLDQLIELGWVKIGPAAADAGPAGDLRGDAGLPRPLRARLGEGPAGARRAARRRADRQRRQAGPLFGGEDRGRRRAGGGARPARSPRPSSTVVRRGFSAMIRADTAA